MILFDWYLAFFT